MLHVRMSVCHAPAHRRGWRSPRWHRRSRRRQVSWRARVQWLQRRLQRTLRREPVAKYTGTATQAPSGMLCSPMAIAMATPSDSSAKVATKVANPCAHIHARSTQKQASTSPPRPPGRVNGQDD
eukprot:scaffold5048_cov338-Prasinococcus_capsulatus_cf.AAC.8